MAANFSSGTLTRVLFLPSAIASRLIVFTSAWAAATAAAAPEPGAAPSPPGRWELRLEPVLVTTGAVPGATAGNGLTVFFPKNGDPSVSFGLNVSVGHLFSRHLEAGFSVGFARYGAVERDFITAVAAPFLKLNSWSSERFNLFVEFLAGPSWVNDSVGGTETRFAGALSVGVEVLFGALGIRAWTGLETSIGGEGVLGIPLRWAFVAYF
jgi:hypothetical protein